MTESVEKDRQRIEAYRKELAQDPRSLAFIGLSETLNRLGEWDDAARVAKKGLEAHPDSVAGRLALAVAEAGRDNIRDALEQIKSALIIDQENPRALALMGSLLLQKGLAKRAIQFLNHATKLAPDSREYADLLRRAKRLAKSESPIQLPVVRAEQVQDTDNPWAEESAEPTEFAAKRESEHTVFDPDAASRLRLGNGRSAVYKPLDDDDAEPTKHGQRLDEAKKRPSELPPPRRVGTSSEPDAAEERTTYNAKNALLDAVARPATPAEAPGAPQRRKPKVGGSAADYSKIVREQDLPAQSLRNEAPTVDSTSAGQLRADALGEGPTTRVPSNGFEDVLSAPPQPAQPPPPPPGPKSAMAPSASRSSIAPAAVAVAPEPVVMKPPSAPRAAPAAAEPPPAPVDEKPAAKTTEPPKAEAAAAEDAAREERLAAKAKAKAERDAAKAEVAKAPDPAKAAEPSKAKAAPPGADRPATMMVDDAIWAIYGGDKPGAKPAASTNLKVDAPAAAEAPAVEKSPARPAKEKKAEAPAADDDGGGRAGVMVVRTASWFGSLTYYAAVLVLAGAAAWAGWALMLSRSGKSVVSASEDLRGVFSDLERGGLASLLAAEEGIAALISSAPELAPVLKGGLAEAHARVWAEFGNDPAMKEKAVADLREIDRDSTTLEVLVARAALSTSAASLAAIDRELETTLEQFPDSPKAWVLRAQLAMQTGRPDEAVQALYAARDLYPGRRQTLLELARWHAKHGALSSAFTYFDELQERYPQDVQAALERYVLGVITGRDPAANEAKSKLAGLVREENPEVAKDEAGRVALAFAVEAYASGDGEGGLVQLNRAEAAFRESARFKETLGQAFLAAGEWDRAKLQFERALELEPDVDQHRVGIALAQHAKLAGLVRPEAARSEKKSDPGTAILPFGTLRLDGDRFELVDVRLSPDHFPVAAFEELARRADGSQLDKRLEARSMVEVARKRRLDGKTAEALALLDKARTLYEDAALYTELGRAQLGKGEIKSALRSLDTAVKLDKEDPHARLALAEARAADADLVGAMEALDPLVGSAVVMPRAHLLLADLKLRRGDDAGARALLLEVEGLDPESAEVQRALGRVEHRLKKPEEALARYQKALAADKTLGEAPRRGDTRSAIDLYYLGRLVLEKSERRGTDLLDAALDREDPPAEARFFLGKTLIKRARTKRQGKKELELFRREMPEGDLTAQAERLLKGR